MAILFVGSECARLENGTRPPNSDGDFIETNVKVLQDGLLTEIHMGNGVKGGAKNNPNVSPNLFKLKIWRENGLNYDFIGQTEPIFPLSETLNSSLCYTIQINSTITVQSGDLFGYKFPVLWPGTPLVYTLGSGTTTGVKKAGDNTTSQPIADFTPFNNHIDVGLFGSVINVPPNQASSLVRAKNPDTGDVMSFLTDYDFSTGGFQTIKSYRSLTGNLHSQQINNFRRFEIPLVQINSQNINFLRSWKADRIRLNFTENHSESNVDSGFLVVITELNISKFKKPYSQNLWTGNIVVETI